MFGCLLVEVWCRCSRGVWRDGDWLSGSFEDNWPGGSFDFVVLVVEWYGGGGDPAFCFAGVELEVELLDICADCAEGVLDVVMVLDDSVIMF